MIFDIMESMPSSKSQETRLTRQRFSATNNFQTNFLGLILFPVYSVNRVPFVIASSFLLVLIITLHFWDSSDYSATKHPENLLQRLKIGADMTTHRYTTYKSHTPSLGYHLPVV